VGVGGCLIIHHTKLQTHTNTHAPTASRVATGARRGRRMGNRQHSHDEPAGPCGPRGGVEMKRWRGGAKLIVNAELFNRALRHLSEFLRLRREELS